MQCLSEKKEGELIDSEPDMVVVFMRVGQDVRWAGFTGSLQEAVREGIGRACAEFSLSSPSRDDALPSSRFTVGRSVPVFIHWDLVPGEQVQLTVAARSGEDESKTRLLMKTSQESIADSVLAQMNELRESIRFPFVLGIGVGGTVENAVLTARECLNDPLNMNFWTAAPKRPLKTYVRKSFGASMNFPVMPEALFSDLRCLTLRFDFEAIGIRFGLCV